MAKLYDAQGRPIDLNKAEQGVKDIGSAMQDLEKPLENLSTTFSDVLDKAKQITDEIKKTKKEEDDVNASGDKTAGIFDNIKGLLGNEAGGIGDLLGGNVKSMLGLGGAATAAAAILLRFNANLQAIGDEFGAIGLQSNELTGSILASQIEVNKLGKGIEDVLAVSKALTDEFGFGLSESIGLTASIVDTSVALGLSTDEGAKLIGSLSTIGGLSADTAQTFVKQVALLAKANDVAPQAVLRDLAGSSESIANFTDGTVENLAKAAIRAKSLGVSLNDVAGALRQTLDIESSLANEREASVLLGRNINLQEVRRLTLANKIDEAQQALIKQLGTEAEFNKLNVLQRESLAKAAGLSVEQLAKIVSQEKEAVSLAQQLAGQPGFEELVGEKGISTLTQLTGSLKSLGATLTNSLGPILNIVLQVLVGIGKALEILLSPINAIIGGGGTTTAIPALANGGVTTAATLAQIGEAGPEAILPLDTFFTQMGTMMERANESVVSAIKEQKLQTRITNNQLEIVSTPANT